MTGDDLVGELRDAVGWVERQDGPAPDWDVLLDVAADRIEEDDDRLDALSVSLREMIAELADALGYVAPYFREKWRYDMAIREARTILDKHGRPE